MLLAGGRVQLSGPPVQVLTSAQLTEHYGARVDVIRHRGNLVVVPMRSAAWIVSPRTSPPTTPAPTACAGRRSLVLGQHRQRQGQDVGGHRRGRAGRRAGAGRSPSSQFLEVGDVEDRREKVCRQLGVDWWAMGEGFTWDSADLTVDQAVSAGAWAHAKAVIAGGDHQLVVLDEVTYPDQLGLDRHRRRGRHHHRAALEHVNVVLTGRKAPRALVDLADTVTEMGETKHAYQSGIRAKKGIDY